MDFENIDVTLDGEDSTIKLLCSLPSEDKYWKQLSMVGNRDEITLEEVNWALLQTELI